MAGTTITLHNAVRINDRMVREIDVKEHKLQFKMLDSGVISLRNEDGDLVMQLSPSIWSHVHVVKATAEML